ncbi:hypothetical protein NHF50_07005 [Flavobacterium sp. NRK F10]|uniref:Lipoprotein n=1 Tax=Flavobacterium sediminis TaxID=2201181 RepID=A0A2U8QU06_9FLAO|nr:MULTISPECIES: hypothetical protein [Flavobacterium]AWM13667.1 hypothetical protein DI487_07185 [Flavobacterium sediminis]MCO6174790.1 hypothetical protein [Flavobacterium sp. NRK F10]
MKTKIFTFLVLTSFIVLSCKIDKENKEENNNSVPQKEVQKDSEVKIVIEAIVPKDDVFQIYYTEDGSPNCTEEQSVKAEIKGSEEPQKITFNIPEEVVMTYLRIDPGQNPDQGIMKFSRFTYEYFGKKFEIIGSDFFLYFSPTEHLKMDFNSATLTPTGKGENYDPVLYAQPPFAPELEKILVQ